VDCWRRSDQDDDRRCQRCWYQGKSIWSCSHPTQSVSTKTLRSTHSYIGIDCHIIGSKSFGYLGPDQDPILHRIDDTVGVVWGRNRDPMTVAEVIPEPLLWQWEYMSNLEAYPVAKASQLSSPAGYNASPISLTYSVNERFNTAPGFKPSHTK